MPETPVIQTQVAAPQPAPTPGDISYGNTFSMEDHIRSSSTPTPTPVATPTPQSQEPTPAQTVTPAASVPVTPSAPPVQNTVSTPGSDPENMVPQSRFNEVTAKRREEERRRIEAEQREAYWRGIAEGRSPQTSPTIPTELRPNPEEIGTKYPTYEDYVSAVVQFDIMKTLEAQKTQETQRREQETQQQTIDRTHAKFMQKLDQVRFSDPVFDQALNDPTFFPKTNPRSQHIAQAIKESEYAADIIKHLYTNRSEVDHLLSISPYAAALELGRLEVRLASAQAAPPTPIPTPVAAPIPTPQPSPPITPKVISQAPEPISTVQPNGSIATDIMDPNLPIDEFMKRRNQAQYGRRK